MSRKRALVAVLAFAICSWVVWVSLSLWQVANSLLELRALDFDFPSVRYPERLEDTSARISQSATPASNSERSELYQVSADDLGERELVTPVSASSPACVGVRHAASRGDHLGKVDQLEFDVAQQSMSRLRYGGTLNEDVSDAIRSNYISAAQDGNTVAVYQLAFFYRHYMADLVEGRAWDIVEHRMRHGSLEGYEEMWGAEAMTEDEKAESLRRADNYSLEFDLSFELIEELVRLACQ